MSSWAADSRLGSHLSSGARIPLTCCVEPSSASPDEAIYASSCSNCIAQQRQKPAGLSWTPPASSRRMKSWPLLKIGRESRLWGEQSRPTTSCFPTISTIKGLLRPPVAAPEPPGAIYALFPCDPHRVGTRAQDVRVFLHRPE